MTWIAAAVGPEMIALAGDGRARHGDQLIADDVVKVTPVFGRFAVAFAGAGGLVTPAIKNNYSEERVRLEAQFGLRHSGFDAVSIADGVVPMDCLIRAATADAPSAPQTPIEVIHALSPYVVEALVTTMLSYEESFFPHVRLFVAGWESPERGTVMHVLYRPPNDEGDLEIEVEELGATDAPGMGYINRRDIDPEIRPRRYEGLPDGLSPAAAARRMIELAGDTDPVRCGGLVSCIAVTRERASAA